MESSRIERMIDALSEQISRLAIRLAVLESKLGMRVPVFDKHQDPKEESDENDRG